MKNFPLRANFEKIELVEYLSMGCAMSEENYIFDFSIGQRIHRKTDLIQLLKVIYKFIKLRTLQQNKMN
ncbi:unnamed protein product [Paramecium octaurelia]|uniref:Uncharacterized protein n=1 Tax=Paramecium octaurelia TaxID=43137 RepID=A0A8S1XR01_PAROT|nr:unnamed protein product [Paramecium octaurelia]